MNLTLTPKRAIMIGLLAASSAVLGGHEAAARPSASPTKASHHVAGTDDAANADRAVLMAHAAGSDRHLGNLSAEIARRAVTDRPVQPNGDYCHPRFRPAPCPF